MEVVPLQFDDFVRWRNSVRAGFGDRISEEESIFMRDHRAEIDRMLSCIDDGEIVGTGGADSFEMTLPGGNQVPVAGVAYITTAPTHRRRGIQRSIMDRIHRDSRVRGDAASILWASMGHLYGRYGYGNAIPSHDWTIRQAHTRFEFASEFNGEFRVLKRDEALPLMEQVYETARLERPGMIDRRTKRWQYEIHPKRNADDFFLIYLKAGEPKAYAQYAFETNPTTNDEFALRIDVNEAVSTDRASYTAIWRFLFDEPLAYDIVAHNRPLDDPIYWMLADPRRLRRETNDAIWLKLLDVGTMLEQRGYGASGEIVIEVSSATGGASEKWLLTADGDGGATCTSTNAEPHLTLPERSLGAAYFGAVSASTLVSVGEAEVSPTGEALLPTIDAMFRCSPAAWNPFHF